MKITEKNYVQIKQLIKEYEFNKEISGKRCNICNVKANNYHNMPGNYKVYRCKDHYPDPYPMITSCFNITI